MPKNPDIKVVRLRKPGCWIYDHPDGSIVVYNNKRKPLDTKSVNFLLDMAKQRLLKTD